MILSYLFAEELPIVPPCMEGLSSLTDWSVTRQNYYVSQLVAFVTDVRDLECSVCQLMNFVPCLVQVSTEVIDGLG